MIWDINTVVINIGGMALARRLALVCCIIYGDRLGRTCAFAEQWLARGRRTVNMEL